MIERSTVAAVCILLEMRRTASAGTARRPRRRPVHELHSILLCQPAQAQAQSALLVLSLPCPSARLSRFIDDFITRRISHDSDNKDVPPR